MTPAIEALVRAQRQHRVIDVGEYVGRNRQVALAERLDAALDAVFKTLIAKLDDGALVTALLPLNRELNLKRLAALAGTKKASMASTSEAERSSGYVVGGVSPLAQRRTLATYADEGILRHSLVYVSAGRRGMEIELSPEDLIWMCSATVGPLVR